MNLLFRYCLAYAASVFGIQIHAFCCMSNHMHLVLTDTRGVLPDFMNFFDAMLAKRVKALRNEQRPTRRWRGRFVWQPGESYEAVPLVNDSAVLKTLAYVLCNPVEAGAVRAHHQWPGAMSRVAQLVGRAERIAKPEGLAPEHGPKAVTLVITPPPMTDDSSPKEVRDTVRRLVDEREADLRAERSGSFSGPEHASAIPWDFVPAEEPEEAEATRPRFTAVDPESIRAAHQAYHEWHEAYRDAWAAHKAGEEAVFPPGTWLWCKKHRFKGAAPDIPPLRC